MKVKTSVTLSEELLDAISAQERNRSEFLEAAAWAYLASQEREERYRRELALLNQYADQLNAEQSDALGYQADA
jgi:metal-responsive CopG/Arc/MetJ family transcriptional regulator